MASPLQGNNLCGARTSRWGLGDQLLWAWRPRPSSCPSTSLPGSLDKHGMLHNAMQHMYSVAKCWTYSVVSKLVSRTGMRRYILRSCDASITADRRDPCSRHACTSFRRCPHYTSRHYCCTWGGTYVLKGPQTESGSHHRTGHHPGRAAHLTHHSRAGTAGQLQNHAQRCARHCSLHTAHHSGLAVQLSPRDLAELGWGYTTSAVQHSLIFHRHTSQAPPSTAAPHSLQAQLNRGGAGSPLPPLLGVQLQSNAQLGARHIAQRTIRLPQLGPQHIAQPRRGRHHCRLVRAQQPRLRSCAQPAPKPAAPGPGPTCRAAAAPPPAAARRARAPRGRHAGARLWLQIESGISHVRCGVGLWRGSGGCACVAR
jgi:hypothetical protein